MLSSMASVSTYLNFLGNTEEAFEFYRSVFGGEFTALNRMDSIPGMELPEADKSKIMHISLPILAGHVLMGTDFLESQGHELIIGNNVTISLLPDTLEDAQALYAALVVNGSADQPIFPAPWGGHYGSLVDQFGIRWMFNVLPA